MNSTWCRALAPAALLLAVLAPAAAQQQALPPQQQQQQIAQNPACVRLEAQLAAYDRGNSDATRNDQIRKLEESAATQQNEIARQEAAAKRMGCEQNSFFVLFSRQPEQCGPLTNRIKQMQAALEQMRTSIDRLQGEQAPPEREAQRRAILGALVSNNCGQQYQAALNADPQRGGGGGGLFETIFGGRPPMSSTPIAGFSPGVSYRTICVRTCDGFYWPISHSANPSRFGEDEKACRQSCPATEATLFAFPNQGGDVTQAMSIGGQPYTSLPNAFRYRQALDQTCSCRRPGESWSQALKNIEDGTVEQGDIVVNEQRARQMSLPRVDAQGRPIRPEPQQRGAPARPDPRTTSSAPPPAPPLPAPAEPAPAAEAPDKPDPNRTVRSVGPTFIAPRPKAN
jgi:hypothetical protein